MMTTNERRSDDDCVGRPKLKLRLRRHRSRPHRRRETKHLQLHLMLVPILASCLTFITTMMNRPISSSVAYVTFQQQQHKQQRTPTINNINNKRIRHLPEIYAINYDMATDRKHMRRRRVLLSFSSNVCEKDDVGNMDEETIRNAYEEWRREYGKVASTFPTNDDGNDNDTSGRHRYENFKRNFLRLQITNAEELRDARANGEPDPIPLRLNEYADLSADEYQSMIVKQQQQQQQVEDDEKFASPSSISTETTSSSSSTFLTFADANGGVIEDEDGKKDVDGDMEQERVREIYRRWCETIGRQYDESRLTIFTQNLRAVELHQREKPDGSTAASLNKYADLRPDEYRTAIMMEQQSSPEAPGSSPTQSSLRPSIISSTGNVLSPTPLTGYTRSSSSYLENLSSSSSRPIAPYRRPASYASTPSHLGTVTSNTGSSYLDNLSGQSPSVSSSGFSPPRSPFTSTSSSLTGKRYDAPNAAESRIREIYQNWCKYYNKLPNEQRLLTFADNLVVLEKHYRDTGEQLTLNEFADQLGFEQRIVDDARRAAAEIEAKNATEQFQKQQKEQAEADEMRQVALKQKEEEDRKRQSERARLEEEKRRWAEEVQLEKERKEAEIARLEALRRQAEEAQRADKQRQLGKSQYEVRRREEASSLQLELLDNVAVPNTSDESSSMPEFEDELEDDPEPIILPRSSYMDAVAKTWVDRSAYLKSLKEEQSTLSSANTKKEPTRTDEMKVQKRSSQSLVDAMWKVMNTSPPSSTDLVEPIDEVDGEYVSGLLKEADQIIADATRSNTINKQELQNLKEAVDALRRRNEDERAAEEARIKAKEWKEIQIGLEKEAKRAREVREYEERSAEEARQSVRSVGSVVSNDQSSIETLVNPFSNFFSSIQKDRMPDTKQFSFFANPNTIVNNETPSGRSLTKSVIFKQEDSWVGRLFDFWGSNNQEQREEFGQGTITLEPAKRSSAFDFFVSRDMLQSTQSGRGSTVIGEPDKPSMLSFFANLGKPNGGVNYRSSSGGSGQDTANSPFSSFFGDSKAIAAEVDPERLRKVEKYESRRRSREERTAWLEAGRSRILEQSDKKLSRKEARRLQRELDDLAVSSLSFDGDIPQLASWSKTPDGRITGYVSVSTSKYRRGTKITTNRIKGQVIKAGVIITTLSGSQYRLLMPLSNQPVDSLGQPASSPSSSPTSGQQQTRQQQGTLPRKTVSFQPLGSFLGGLFLSGGEDSSGGSIPTLVEWIQNEDGTLTGFVNNKEGFDDGTVITTSPVKRAKEGMVVQTAGGSKYRLLKQGRKK